ncbi:MAG: PAS domain S-box protein [Candidatus Thorarchaeota archaeon]
MSISVLMVDDDVDLLRIASELLKREDPDFRIDKASSVKEAVSLLENSSYDCVVSDYMMPEVDGLTFLEKIREGGREIPFIIFTGRSREEVAINALNLGATRYVTKGGDPKSQYAELAHIIRTAVEHSHVERELSSVIENIPIGMHMYHLEPDDRLVFSGANPAADQLLGVDNSQFVGKTIEDAFPPLTDTEIPTRYRDAAATGKAWSTEQIDYEDEKVRGAFQVHAFQTLPNRMVASFLDITERAQAEDELRRYRDQLEQEVKVRTMEQDKTTEQLREEIEERTRAAIIIDRERRAFRLIAEASIQSNNARDLCTRVLADLTETLGFGLGTIRLYDEKRGALDLFAIVGLDEQIHTITEEAVIEESDTLFAHVARTKKPIFAPDISDHKIMQTHAERIEKLGLRSLIMWPILGKGESLVGTLSLAANEPRSISDDISVFFSTVSELLSVALSRIGVSEALEESEARYRLLAENAKDIIATLNMKMEFTYMSPSVEEITGYSIDEAKTLTLENILTPESSQIAMTALGEALELEERVGKDGYEAHPLDLELVRKDGSVIWVEVTRAFLRSEDETPTGVLVVVRDISGRKVLEEELLHTEMKYKAILAQSNDGIFVLDFDSIHREVNKRGSEMLGYEPGELIGRPISDTVAESELLESQENLDAVLRGDDLPIVERLMKRKDGSTFPVEINVVRVRDQKDRPLYILSIMRDITQRKEYEGAIRRSEKRLSDLITSVPEGIGITDLDETLLFVNRAFAEMLGYTEDELINTSALDLVPEDEMHKLTEGTAERKKGVTSTYEVRMKHKNGDIRTVRLSAVPQMTEAGDVEGTISVIVDITERARIERELRKLSQALEFSPSSVVITDTKGTIEYVNPKFTELTGYRFDESVGQNPKILQSGLTPQDTFDDLWAHITAGKEWQGQFINKKKDGELYWEDAFISPIINRSGIITHYVAVKQEISARIQAEAELRASNRDLQLYASLLRHDLANDLQVILTTSESASIVLTDDSSVAQFCEPVKGAAERMGDILAMFGTPEVPTDSDIVYIVEQRAQQAERAQLGLSVLVKASDSARKVKILGRSLLPSVVDNLLRNASQYGGEGITVEVILERVGNIFQIDVRDDGPGISEDIRTQLFQKGVSTTGGGQGLYLSKRIMEAYGGSIQLLESDKGAAFRIRLPVI